jgi:transcriptional regulator of acetoin/glycerol metabolism
VEDTRSIGKGKGREAADPPGVLVLAMEGARPTAPPAVFELRAVEEIVIGRGPERRAARAGASLRLDVADPWMSQTHARLSREAGEWVLADAGSKNGTFLNGIAVDEAGVDDGDVFEAGGTMFVLRPRWAAVEPGETRPAFRTLIPDLARELGTLERVARATVPLLVTGETGTGKEVVARAVHEVSGRRGPFVPVNCGALPATLVESELFGAKKGAFSGAAADRAGLVVQAHQGTLLLDEIGELPEAAQAALLRALQDGEVRPLGGAQTVKVDLRVVAATHVDLAQRVEEGRFRRDLYARLRGYQFTLPPLRERREDLGLFIAHLLARVDGERAAARVIERDAARALFAHAWPLNVRELEQALRAACAVAPGDELELEHLPPDLRAPPAAPRALDQDAFAALVRVHKGNVAAVARALATSRSQVRRLAKRYGVDLEAERSG